MTKINDQEVGPIGFGLMGFTWRPNPCPEEQAFATMRASLEQGCNLWNGGEIYGPPSYNSLVLLERYFSRYPEDADKVVLSIKGGVDLENLKPDGSPEGIRRSMDDCLNQIKGRKKIDIFECARRDPNTPLEVTFGVLQKEYIETGKLGGISLSEVSAATIHEAVKIAKIVAVEVELSLWSTDVLENGVAAACAQYGIPLIAYSPMGRGILTGQIKSPDDFPEGDFRRHFPRFQPENFEVNVKLVAEVEKLARKKGCTPAQLAINWVRCLSKRPGMPVIIPIPGSTTVDRVRENALVIDITGEEMAELDAITVNFEIKGTRYPAGHPVEG